MSGVKSLRAMFEQKGDVPLPDRGRSPGPSGFASPSPSASPRRLSKVRTAFVAIEKDGQIGLVRDHSRDSVSVSSRRLSGDTEATTPQPPSERAEVFSDGVATNIISKMNLSHESIPESIPESISESIPESIPESPEQDSPIEMSPTKELQGPLLQPDGNLDKVTEEEESHAEMPPTNPTESAAAPNGAASGPTAAKVSNKKPTAKTAAPASATKAASRATRSPTATKSHGAKESRKATVSPANTKKAAAAKADRPQSGMGFVKPKPKSPTRPIKLPSSLTTHTASSAQKFGNGTAAPTARRSVSRASASAPHLLPSSSMHRSPSRNSMSAAGAKGLTRKPSSLNMSRTRPSIGPPPKQSVTDLHPKKDSPVDESFLARMTRPTQSSAQKAADKTSVSPTRKSHFPVKKPETKEVEKVAKKVTPKVQPVSSKGKTAKDGVKPVAAKEQPKAKGTLASSPTRTTHHPVIKQQKTRAQAESHTEDVTREDGAVKPLDKISETTGADGAHVEHVTSSNGAEGPGPVATDSTEESAHQPTGDTPKANEAVVIPAEGTGVDVQSPIDGSPELTEPKPDQGAKTDDPGAVASRRSLSNEDRTSDETNGEVSAVAQ
ncbi:hypothetical protein GGR50DRAFT_554338 [Xylaria sp. CBS 124048]|nr:hypothetical protein GGR50DRAFT_554338 [Xylaria sp. CBS 124048]